MKLGNFEKKFETLILSYANMETVQPWETSDTYFVKATIMKHYRLVEVIKL